MGYLLVLNSTEKGPQHVFVSMKASTDDPTQIDVPTAKSKIRHRRSLESMDVYTDVDGVTSGEGIATGNIEFWPDNYAPLNSGNVPGASRDAYDFGGHPLEPRNGYGSMQVHNFRIGRFRGMPDRTM